MNLRVRIELEEPLDFGVNYPVVALYNSPYKNGDCPIVSYECKQYDEATESWDNLYDETSANASVRPGRVDVFDTSGEFELVKGRSYVLRVYNSGKSAGGGEK